MKKNLKLVSRPGAFVAATLLLTGCASVVRENILSSINTGIGATVSPNPQTQIYEVKAGYIRSQFYSIPTGKTVSKVDTNATAHWGTNSPAITPQVVSGISVNGSMQNLFLNANIAENFAVGESAVNSPAAVAMYLSGAMASKGVSSNAMDALIESLGKKMGEGKSK